MNGPQIASYIRELQAKVKQLEERVAQLEAKRTIHLPRKK